MPVGGFWLWWCVVCLRIRCFFRLDGGNVVPDTFHGGSGNDSFNDASGLGVGLCNQKMNASSALMVWSPACNW